MATLEKIRNRAGILVAGIIGLALIAFILGDMLTSGRSFFSGDQYEIAEISGKSIQVQQYQQKVEEVIENYKTNTQQASLDEATVDMLREETWNQLIRENIMSEEYEDLGIGVSADEWNSMLTGDNIHPQIQKSFTDPNTGLFDKNRVTQYLNYIKDADANAKASWFAFANSLMDDRANTKYNTLIQKGIYIAEKQAENEVIAKNHKVNFSYVNQNYKSIPDSIITVNDEEIKEYYNKNIHKFDQETSRDIEYVTFDILPSQEDRNEVKEWIYNISREFSTIENDAQYVNLNADTHFEKKFVTKDELPTPLDTILFDAEKGKIYGPFVEGDIYKVAKLSDIKFMPDSVNARHILIKAENGDYASAQKFVDSLKTLIENGADFAELAKEHGTDGTKDKGGDLGWFTKDAMVFPFNDTCFFSSKGHLTTVATQFGVHLVEVLDKSADKKRVQISIIDRKVAPSSKTIDEFYVKASEFAGTNNTAEKFDNAVTEQGFSKRIANNLKENDKTIAGLENPRELIKWAYKSEKNDISDVFEFGNRFVVAKLIEIREKGKAPIDQVKTEIEVIVKKDKKAEKLIEDMKNISSLNELADKLNTEIKEATNISFSSFQIPGAGMEPNVIAIAVNSEKDKISTPIKGTNGVYVIQINEIIESSGDIEAEKSTLIRNIQSRVGYQAYEALKEGANIVDKRSKFY